MPYTGSQVVQKHQSAVRRCRGQSGWDALRCIVNSMRQEYKGAEAVGAGAGGS